MDREKVGGVKKMNNCLVAKCRGKSVLSTQKCFPHCGLGDVGQVHHLPGP